MKTITIRLRDADLSREMAAMRSWLDHNCYEPRRFRCDQHGDEVVFSVAFMIDAEADAFAARFQAGNSASELG
jgi:hypothetical protein